MASTDVLTTTNTTSSIVGGVPSPSSTTPSLSLGSSSNAAADIEGGEDATLILTNALLESFQPTLRQISAQLGEIQFEFHFKISTNSV